MGLLRTHLVHDARTAIRIEESQDRDCTRNSPAQRKFILENLYEALNMSSTDAKISHKLVQRVECLYHRRDLSEKGTKRLIALRLMLD